MDDLLKSLTVLDYGEGQIRGVDYETLRARLRGWPATPWCSTIRAACGTCWLPCAARKVQLLGSDGSAEAGILVGLERLRINLWSNRSYPFCAKVHETVAVLSLNRIAGVELRDENCRAADLRFFLQTALGQETHRSINIRLSPAAMISRSATLPRPPPGGSVIAW